jgi:hypothetical protein
LQNPVGKLIIRKPFSDNIFSTAYSKKWPYRQSVYLGIIFLIISRRKNNRLFFAIAIKVPPNISLPLTASKRYRQYVLYRLPFGNYRTIALPFRFVTVFKTVTAVYPQFYTNYLNFTCLKASLS